MRHLIPEFEKLKERLPKGLDSTLVLPCLRRIQEDRGYIADEDIDGLVEYLDVPRIQIEEVLTFYSMLRRKPIGRFHLQGTWWRSSQRWFRRPGPTWFGITGCSAPTPSFGARWCHYQSLQILCAA